MVYSYSIQWFDAVYNADIEYIKKHPKNINKVREYAGYISAEIASILENIIFIV
jgi:hypothetical protein